MKAARRSVLVLFLAFLCAAAVPGIAGATFAGLNGPFVFDEPGLDNSSDLYTIKPDGTGRFKLTNAAPGIRNIGGAFDNGSGQVTYVRFDSNQQNSNSRIHVIDADGTGDVAISPADQLDTMPAFSPDNGRIVFVRRNPESESLGGDIYTMNVDGSNPVQLTSSSSDALPVYSPDGSEIAFTRTTELWLMNADGSNQRRLGASAVPAGGRPSFSPDGSRIAFEAFFTETPNGNLLGGIHSVAVDGSGRRVEVTDSQDNSAASPAYSPDGASLGYMNQVTQAPGRRAVPPYTPAGDGINISDLTSGQTTLINPGTEGSGLLDWGNVIPDICRVRFSKARLFVFKKKPVYRLVARYWSDTSGQVEITFHSRNDDGSRGIPLGSVTHNFSGNGRFRISKRVSTAQAQVLRTFPNGYIADVTIQAKPDYCPMGYSVDLTRLKRVKNQFVWFQQQ